MKENRENKSKCPFSKEEAEKSSSDLLGNKKVTVSITTNEEKEKEANLSKSLHFLN